MPAPKIEDTACDEFVALAKYAQDLQEAYHSRATLNRALLYVAGTIALGTMAAGGALAAASAASRSTLALLSISGGFTSGFFGVLDNQDLAVAYTTAAKEVETTLTKANSLLLVTDGHLYAPPGACFNALILLQDGLKDATNSLEQARTDTAVLALKRALAQKEELDNLIGKVEGPQIAGASISNENPKIGEKVTIV